MCEGNPRQHAAEPMTRHLPNDHMSVTSKYAMQDRELPCILAGKGHNKVQDKVSPSWLDRQLLTALTLHMMRCVTARITTRPDAQLKCGGLSQGHFYYGGQVPPPPTRKQVERAPLLSVPCHSPEKKYTCICRSLPHWPCFTASLNTLLAVKLGVADASRSISSPVRGFLPLRALRSRFSKAPNPGISTRSPTQEMISGSLGVDGWLLPPTTCPVHIATVHRSWLDKSTRMC
jgi:hypothetical protein